MEQQRELGRISEKIRKWREEAGLTLQQLGGRAGVSPSTIHKVENNQTVPSIAVVLKLAHGLGRRPSELIEDRVEEVGATVTRNDQRSVLVTPRGTTIEHLVGDLSNAQIDVWRVRHRPGFHSVKGQGDRPQYPGELIFLCEEGELIVEVGGKRHHLHPGDTIHFQSSIPHQWHNPGDGHATAVVIATNQTDSAAGLASALRALQENVVEPFESSD